MAGTSTFVVQVQDSGGTANGGVDTSVSQPFTITVLNAPPTAVQSSFLNNQSVDHLDRLAQRSAARTLVRAGRIAKSITNNPSSCLYCWPDEVTEVVRPSSVK